jgi:hypothetical protein
MVWGAGHAEQVERGCVYDCKQIVTHADECPAELTRERCF